MKIATNVEVHFHQQEEASIFLESNVSGNEERVGEIGLFTFFALRIMNNLGINDTSDSVGQILSRAGELVPHFATGTTTRGAQLITYPGYPGRKQFIASLRMNDQNARFDMKPKGFGWLGTGLGYYAPTAVMRLLRYLARQRADDSDFQDGLVLAAVACGALQLRHQISLTNQVQSGLAVLAAACAKYRP